MGSSDLGICGIPSPWTIPPRCAALWSAVIWPRHIKSDDMALEVRVKGMIAQVGSHLPCWFRGNAWRGADGFCRSTRHCTTSVMERNLALSPQDPLCGLRTATKKWDPLSKTGQEHLCQYADQTVEESFKLGMMEKGGGDSH